MRFRESGKTSKVTVSGKAKKVIVLLVMKIASGQTPKATVLLVIRKRVSGKAKKGTVSLVVKHSEWKDIKDNCACCHD